MRPEDAERHRLDDITRPAELPKLPDHVNAETLKNHPALGVYIGKMTEAQGIRIEAKLDRLIEVLERMDKRIELVERWMLNH